MARDEGGVYSLPIGINPVVPGTIIASDWANPTMEDIARALTDSLSRTGNGDMLYPLRGPDASAAVPTFSFSNEPSTGRYRDGPGTVVESILGTPVVRYTINGMEQWNGSAWEPLTPRDARGTPFDPDPTALTSTNVQDAIEEVFSLVGGSAVHARDVQFDDTNVYFGAPSVQIAIEIMATDLAENANDVIQNAEDIVILEGEVDILNNAVTGLIDDVNKNEGEIALINTWISGHEDDYDNLAAIVSQHGAEISTLDGRVDGHDQALLNHDSRLNGHDNDINSLETRMGVAEIDINNLQSDVGAILGGFSNGVLKVSYGGTGVQSKTGSGSVVLNNSPYITGGTIENLSLNNVTGGGFFSLGNNATAQTKGTSDNDTSVATTAFVHNLLDTMGGGDITMESGAGSWVRWKRGSTTVLQVCWGNALYGNTGNRVISFPKTFPNSGNVRVFLQQYGSAIAGGRDWAPTISAMSSSSFTYGSSYDCIYFAIGF